jgi:hypothetical protein
MRKYALINNNTVTEIVEVDELECEEYARSNQMVIDIEDMSPMPVVGYVLNGNVLEIPQGRGDRETFEYNLAVKKTDFGIKICRVAIDRIGARNKILNKTGSQVTALLNQLIGIKMLLETGALGTARYSCTLLLVPYSEYADILNDVIEQINSFEASNGL